ncbi:MAG TPA: hypothetical protein VH306_01745 [Gaiellaceae bacterium]
MSSRTRRWIFVAVVVGAASVTAALVGKAALRGDASTAGATRVTAPASSVAGKTRVFYRSTEKGALSGRVILATVTANGASKQVSGLTCDRFAFAHGRGLCLATKRSFGSSYVAKIVDSHLNVLHEIKLSGIPSRARVSSDGRYGSSTVFVTGHSYAVGRFSTATTIYDMATGKPVLANLEQLKTTTGGERITAVDMNYWGVTFAADPNTFYATLATGGRTYLVRGNVAQRTAVILRENVECPSLSPDGKRIAYKYLPDTGRWRLHVLELATGRDVALAETRTVDDQAEWLDDDHVLYQVDESVWVVPADGTGTPKEYLPDASSPGVLR